MSINSYESDFRPNYELMLAGVWLIGGAAAVVSLIYWTRMTLVSALEMSFFFFAISSYQVVQALRRNRRMALLSKQERTFLSMDDLRARLVGESQGLFLGMGFDWTLARAQKVADLMADTTRYDLIRSAGRGATYLHGIGYEEERDLYMDDGSSKGHVLIVGTTGAGKTRLFDLLVTQTVLRGEPTIIIDPKGDQELRNNCEAAYQRAGRADAFAFFHPAFLQESAAINPLGNFQRISELATRIASIIPTDGKDNVFQSYSQNALMSIFFAVLMGGTTPTLMDIQRALSHGFAPITHRAILGWARKYQRAQAFRLENGLEEIGSKNAALRFSQIEERRASYAVEFYRRLIADDATAEVAEMTGLVSLFEHDREHFSKMIASLVPLIGQLCSGPLQYLLSPSREEGRLPPSGKVVTLDQVIQNGGGLYIGLDTLSDEIVGSRIGQLMLADLAAIAGKNYNFGGTGAQFINIFVDEASEVASAKLIQLLNKGRGGNFRIFVATQTLADFEARTGSKAMAEMIEGNMNTVIMLRTLAADTQESLSSRLPEVPIRYIMKTASTSLADDSLDTGYAVSHGERLMHEMRPFIAPQTFGDLSDLEFFARLPRGELLKGRLPILDPPGDITHLPVQTESVSTALRQLDVLINAPDLPADPDHELSAGISQTSLKSPLAGRPVADPPPVAPDMMADRDPEDRPGPLGQLLMLLPPIWIKILPALREEDMRGRRERANERS